MVAFAGRYDENLLERRDDGIVKAVTSASVKVYETGTTTEATLYTDRAKSTTTSQPISPDANGNLEFFANPGTYDLEISIDGTVRSTNSIVIQPDGTEALNSIEQVFNVLDHGAVGDASADDTTAIQDAIDAAAAVEGIVFVPAGTYKVTSQIVLKARVQLIGVGSRASVISAASASFPTSTAVIRIGAATDTFTFNSLIKDLRIACNNITGSIGVYSHSAQENSGLVRCLITKHDDAGMRFDTDAAHYVIDDVEINSGSLTSHGIDFNGGQTHAVTNVTISPDDAGVGSGYGFYVRGGEVKLSNCHVERKTAAVYVEGAGKVTAVAVDGHNCTSVIEIDAAATDQASVLNIRRDPSLSTNVLKDNRGGETRTEEVLPFGTFGSGGYMFATSSGAVHTNNDINHDGANAGFFGTAPAAQPSLTYSRTGETTPEAQIRTALSALGLVADNTTA